jgi:DNA-binding PadR family transcriptional regulator
MGFLKARRAARRADDERRVLAAIAMLRPSQASGYPISRLAHMGVGKVYAVLARLERSGRVASDWADGPYPRRRLYRATQVGVRS